MAATTVFISYRRDDSVGHAGRLFDRLAEALGRENVFRDIDTIAAGDDFAEAIRTTIAKCDVLLALIGPRWLTAADESGRWRLADETDLVRIEIELALARNIRVIPLLLQGAKMPREADLPGALARLAHRNAVELRDTAFDGDVAQLIALLAPSWRHRWYRTVTRGPAVALAGLVLAGLAGSWGYRMWASTPERARLQLGQMGLAFDAETFVASAEKRDAQALALFLRAGIDPGVEDHRGETAISYAARQGDLALVRQLAARGVDTRRALTLAAGWGQMPVIEFLLSLEPDREAMGNAVVNAAGSHNGDAVKTLLAHGADVNVRGGRYAATALDEAAEALDLPIVQLLIEHGADVSAANEYGRTALHAAIGAQRADDDEARKHAQLEIVALLLDKGANIEAPMQAMANWQPTPLLLAVHEKHSAVALLLIERGADVKAATGDAGSGQPRRLSVLMQATQQGLVDVVQAAIARGVDVNAADAQGWTPLMFAAREGRPEAARILLAHGARRDLKNRQGDDALKIAAKAEQGAMRQLLAGKPAPP